MHHDVPKRQTVFLYIIFKDNTKLSTTCTLFREAYRYDDRGLEKFIYYHVVSNLEPEQIKQFKSIETTIDGRHHSIS